MYESDTLGRHSVHSLQSARSIQTAYSTQSLHTARSYKVDVDRQSLSALHIVRPDEVLLRPSSVEYHRQKSIDNTISNFYITFEEKDYYKPGEKVRGKVEMDIWSELEVRYVEFILTGRGTVRIFTGRSSSAVHPWGEVYLDKRILLMAPSPGKSHLVLKPGRYVSTFSYQLPEKLPPTLGQFDAAKDITFDISYFVQANVCDSLHDSVIHKRGKHVEYVHIIKSCKRAFTVGLQREWQTIPGAMDPVIHAEQLQLFCAPSTGEPTSVMVHLNRGIYTPGDTIRINVEAFTPNGRRVRQVKAVLEQTITLTGKVKRKTQQIIITARDGRADRSKDQQKNMMTSKFAMPIPPTIVPSYLPGCRLVSITYTMHITTKFRGCSGKLVNVLPIHILQQSVGNKTTEDSDVPLFVKPVTQYPKFVSSPIDDLDHNIDLYTSDNTANPVGSGRDVLRSGVPFRKVGEQKQKAKYTAGCCHCCISCCGVGLFKD